MAVLAAAVASFAACNNASDNKKPSAAVDAKPGSPASAAPNVASATSTAADEQFAVPAGPAEELLKFIERIAQPTTPLKDDSEVLAYHTKAAPAIALAADRILAGESTDEQAFDAVNWKLEALRIKGQLGDKQADANAEKFLDQMSQHKRPGVRGAVARMRLSRNLAKWETQTEAQRLAALNKYVADLKANGLTREDAGLLEQLSVMLSSGLFPTSDAAAAPYRELLPLYRDSDKPEIAALTPFMEGVVRRLELPGKKLELEGKFLGGKPFDWQAYRGKVVLVDFWATDCGECLIEVPNVLKNYHMYHDKGFEVLGVNMDLDSAQVSRLIEETGIEWPSLFAGSTEAEQWFHPMATKFSINAIPRAILVDKDGTVVHMNARGPILGEQLKKLLGDPAKPEEDLFAVPDGTPAEILKFVKMRAKTMGSPHSLEEEKTNRKIIGALLTTAVDKIFAGQPTADEAAEAIQMKMSALKIAEQSDTTGDVALENFLKQLEGNPQPAVAGAVAQLRLMQSMVGWKELPSADRAAAVDKYLALVKQHGPANAHVIAFMRLAERASATGENELALRAVNELLPLYRDSTNPEIAKGATQLEGLVRRIKLPGGPIALEGKLLDGKPLDWESYRGKVVLVDFWATWNQQSRQEISNILEVYKKYHDKGFEVLGISLDDKRSDAESYIREAQITWPSLYSEEPGAAGPDNPMATRYAVFEIPLAILVDRQGKVVSMLARGPGLETQVQQLLGDAATPAAQKTPEPKQENGQTATDGTAK